MIINPDVYDIDRVKKFVKHLAIASKKASEREVTKQKFEKQVAKVKKLSLEKAPKVKLGKEWDKLEKALHELIKTNKAIVDTEQSNSLLLRRAVEKIDKLNKSLAAKEGFEGMKGSLTEERLGELQGKIKSKFTQEDIELMEQGLEKIRTPETDEEIGKIEAELALLEKKHDDLKKSGKHSPAALKKLESMIKGSKKKLKGMK